MITIRDAKVFLVGFIFASILALVFYNSPLTWQVVIAGAIQALVLMMIIVLMLTILVSIVFSFIREKELKPK